MIQANEIRIGNYYQYPDATIFQVEKSDLQDHRFWEDAEDNLENIPLTEEWILKLGFNQIRDGQFQFQFTNILFLTQIGVFYQVNFYVEGCSRASRPRHNLDIRYVHQLQNLFFALCGTELAFTS